MNIKKKFLTLSIKHQITLVIILISSLCLLSILGLFSLYSNIIINIQSRKRKEYYFKRYKEVIDSKVRFQTFLLYQYEQLIKGFNSQIYYYGLSKDDLYDTMINYKDDLIKNYDETTEEDYDPDLPDDKKVYYLYSFSDDVYMNSKVYYRLANTHSSIDNQLKGIRNFRITYFGSDLSIINEYLFVPLSQKSVYSINRTRIKAIEEQSNGDFVAYYDRLIKIFGDIYIKFMNDYKKGELPFMDIFFESKYEVFSNYVNETYLRDVYRNDVKEYLNNISYHFNFINYTNERTFGTDNGDKNSVTFIEQNTIIQDYLNFIFSKIQKSLDINSIPVFSENSTIISVNLCYAFLYKQIMLVNANFQKDIFDEPKLKEIYNKLQRGISNIGDCILDKKYNYDTNQNAYDVLNIKFNKYYSIKNRREYSLFKLSETSLGENYFCTKYSFPDFQSMLSFKPTFFTLEQLNLYSFSSFYEPVHYYNNTQSFFYNIQFMILLFLLYLWIIIFIYLYFRAVKLFKEVIDPIKNLSKVINKLDVKEDNVLKYEPDDSINELFKLCNDLLLGKYKQKNNHDLQFDKGSDINEKNKNINDFNNLKINRKLIEEMMENKNEYNIKGDEIITFKINDYLNNRRIAIKENAKENLDLRKTTIFKNKPSNVNDLCINNIQDGIKKTQSIDQTINILNKKLSFDNNFVNNYENLIPPDTSNDEDRLEIEMLLNYKNLYHIIELIYHYDIKSEGKFISKNSRLLYKSNINNYNKYHKAKTKKRPLSSQYGKEEINDENSANDKDIKKSDSKIRIEEFDKSVINAYETRNSLFLWYEEAKYFYGIEFLQNNHTKDLNNLCNLNFGNELKKQSSNQLANNNNNNNNNNNTNFNNTMNNLPYPKKPQLRKSNRALNKTVSKNDLIRKSKTIIDKNAGLIE